jgi:iron complex transport system substrate-binding protein
MPSTFRRCITLFTAVWEAVIERDPEITVLDDAWWSPAARKVEYLRSNPALAGISAVREGRFLAIPAPATVPGVRFSGAVETCSGLSTPKGS